MAKRPAVFQANGVRTKRERDQAADERRGSAASRGYNVRWMKARRTHLARSPLCRPCEVGLWGGAPKPVAAELVDHWLPHRGDTALFWRTDLWVSMCRACHSGPKQALEAKGDTALTREGRRLALPL